MQLRSREVFRAIKGPCIFCLRDNVLFTKEDLPLECLVGKESLRLIDWVCGECNGAFSVNDKYFGNNYHAAIGRVVTGIIGKKGRGAEVARQDLFAKFQPSTNTIQFHIKTAKDREQLLDALQPLTKRRSTKIEIEQRVVNNRRLGRCLAKMALETVAVHAPEMVLEPIFDPIRQYARDRGPLTVLPFAMGITRGGNGISLTDIKFDDSNKRVMVSLLALPTLSYAVQLSDLHDLHPLWHVAKLFGMVFGEDGYHTEKLNLNLNLDFVNDA